MRVKIRPLLCMAGIMLLTACYHDFHDREADATLGYLSPELLWDEPSDAYTPIDHLQFAIAGQTATTANRSFTSNPAGAVNELTAPRQSSSWREPLPPGSYSVFVAANMSSADGFRLTEQPATGATPAMSVSLTDPAASPAQAWFGLGQATVSQGRLTVVQCPLQRLLSSLTVRLTAAPAGTTAILSVQHVAVSVNLTARDDEGRYGVPSTQSETVSFGAMTADGTALTTAGHTLLPTATGYDRSYVAIDVTTPTGVTRHCVADAPRMVSGKHYTLEIGYADLHPYMYLNSYVINDWEEGWTINGQVINPDN